MTVRSAPLPAKRIRRLLRMRAMIDGARQAIQAAQNASQILETNFQTAMLAAAEDMGLDPPTAQDLIRIDEELGTIFIEPRPDASINGHDAQPTQEVA
jgi:hypothetical protein